jgi:hypothetical protein
VTALREALEGLVNRWAVGGNGINAESCDLISACSAELLGVLDGHPDAPGSEPQPAKVTVVERDDHPARLFAANSGEVLTYGIEAGDLVLRDEDDIIVVQLGARMWDSVCNAEAILPADLYARWGKKLAIALDALKAIENEPHPGYGPERATKALDDIRELDL